jgi:hypothetical protein
MWMLSAKAKIRVQCCHSQQVVIWVAAKRDERTSLGWQTVYKNSALSVL